MSQPGEVALLLAVGCGIVYHLLSLWCARSIMRANLGVPADGRARVPPSQVGLAIGSAEGAHVSGRSPSHQGCELPVSILKPLCGAEPHAYDCFASFCRQEYPEYELVFGVMEPGDPAVAVVRRLQAEFAEVPIRLVVSDRRLGANLKASNLANMLPEARHPLLVICDSDMRVTPDYLDRITAPLADANVRLVTCPYRGVEIRGASTALEALGMATEFLPGVLLVARLAGADFAFGSTIALHRDTLRAIGGFEGIADHLADDFQLGHRVARAGWRVAIAPYVLESVLPDHGFGPMFARRLRWARTVRVCRPVGHAASLITQSTAFAGALLVASGFSPLGWGVLAAQQGVRWLTAWRIAVGELGNRELRRWFWLLPASDLLGVVLWAGSWLGNRVVWRGTRFYLGRDGRLREVSREEAARG